MDDIFKILPVTHHSALVGPGSVFVAIRGFKEDGATYIPEAIRRGAREIVIDQQSINQQIIDLCKASDVRLTPAENPRRELALRSAQAHGFPAQSLRIVGITGTKGKTTTAFLTRHILAAAGLRTALLTTAENAILDKRYPTQLTTQQPDYLHAFFRECIRQGVTHVVLEAAAQAFSMQRLEGIAFDAAVFLNFSQEHGEFYATEADYWAAKAQIIGHIKPGGSLILPQNDLQFSVLSIPNHIKISTWSAQDIEAIPPVLHTPTIGCLYKGQNYRCPSLLGEHNGANLLAALTLASAIGVDFQAIPKDLPEFAGVPGRLNWYRLPNGAVGCIDYAHNPASFQATLGLLRQCSEDLIVVFGAGGDRAPERRPHMGRIAGQYADQIILTSDNPRSEDPSEICKQIYAGILPEDRPKVALELDRERAIRLAYQKSRSGSLIVLLGKGPDEYQLVKGVKTPFSEKAILFSL